MKERDSTTLSRIALLALWPILGCAGEPAEDRRVPATPAVAEEETLEVPFTAEQIRAEWRPGLTLVLHFAYPDREEWQRWVVVEADEEKAQIDYLPLDSQGQAIGAPERAPSRWTELRDHARFAANESRRERARRATALGELEGWLYRVHDPEAETMTDYFFADELPGAPVWFQSRMGERVILTVNQIARQHLGESPAADPETAPGQG
jgi:hypothetical protein